MFQFNGVREADKEQRGTGKGLCLRFVKMRMSQELKMEATCCIGETDSVEWCV